MNGSERPLAAGQHRLNLADSGWSNGFSGLPAFEFYDIALGTRPGDCQLDYFRLAILLVADASNFSLLLQVIFYF
jgi:hypothetical protein